MQNLRLSKREYYIATQGTKNFTREELAMFDGANSGKKTYICARGLVFDVSASDFYNSKKAPYNVFAGRDASRALGLSSTEPRDCHDDISELDEDDIHVLNDWVGLFASKYELAGVLPDSRARDIAQSDGISGLVLIHVWYFPAATAAAAGAGKGTILCVHGFPDCSYSFRHNVGAMQQAGYNVIVPDQRGYVRRSSYQSPCGQDASEYAMEKVIQDNLAILDYFRVQKPILLGHDWGGALVWNFVCMHPDRVAAVAAVCTPFYPVPKEDPWPKLQANPGRFEYQVYFNDDRAVTELDSSIERTLSFFLRGASESDVTALQFPRGSISKRGGLLAGLPDKIPRSAMLSEDELQAYVKEFSVRGFRGGCCWYRNTTNNYKMTVDKFKVKNHVAAPCLMVCAEFDFILPPSMTETMSQYIPNLTRTTLPTGHFLHQEKPEEFNKVLLAFLDSLPGKSKL